MLGEPQWLLDASTNSTRVKECATVYGGGDDLITSVAIAMKSIRIADDEIERAVLEDIVASIRKAAYVYFIGFGFDERNLEKLSAPASMQAATVRGTAFEWTRAERSPIARFFGDVKIHLYPKSDAIGFLREHAEALFDRDTSMGQIRKRGGIYWIRYYRNGQRIEESARTDEWEEARDLLRTREGDIAKGVPLSAKIGRLRFEEAADDS